MDAVQQFTDRQNITTPKTFVVAGASKVNLLTLTLSSSPLNSVVGQVGFGRSGLHRYDAVTMIFVAWLTAAVDNQRVIAAIPIVMDILNFQTVGFHLHLDSSRTIVRVEFAPSLSGKLHLGFNVN